MAVTYGSNVFTISQNAQQNGTGTIACSATTIRLGLGTFGATSIIGAGTSFLTQLRAGTLITVSGTNLLIHSVQSNTTCIAFRQSNADNTFTLSTSTAFTFYPPTLWADLLTAVAGQSSTIANGNALSINFTTASLTINSNSVLFLDDFVNLTFGSAAGYRVNNNNGFLVFKNGGALTYTGNVQHSFFNGYLNVFNGTLTYQGNNPGGTSRQDFFSPSSTSNGMSSLTIVYSGGTNTACFWYTHLEPLFGKFGNLTFVNATVVQTLGVGSGINIQFGNGTYTGVELPSRTSTFGILQNITIYLARSGGETVLVNPTFRDSTLTLSGDTTGSARFIDETWKDLASGTLGTLARDSTYPGNTTVTRIFTYYPGTFYQPSDNVYLRIANTNGITAINGAVTSSNGILLPWQTYNTSTQVTNNLYPFTLTARRDDIEEVTSTFTPTAPITYNNPLKIDAYATSNASTQNGITITGGATKTISIATSSLITLDLLYDFLKYYLQNNLSETNFLNPNGKEIEMLNAWQVLNIQWLNNGTKLTNIKSSSNFTATAIWSNLNINGNVSQTTPTNLSNVIVSNSIIYNTNTASSITFTNANIGTILNNGTGIVTINQTNSTVTTYTDAEINYLDSVLNAVNVTSVTLYSSIANRDSNTSAGPTFTTTLPFKYGSIVSGVTMTGTVYARVIVTGITLFTEINLVLSINTLDLGIQGQLTLNSATLSNINAYVVRNNLGLKTVNDNVKLASLLIPANTDFTTGI